MGDTHFELAKSADDAKAGKAITYPMITFGDKHIAITNVIETADQISFSLAHGLTDGQQVVYHAVAGKRIGGLVDGATYTVVRIGDNTIQLKAVGAPAVKK